MNALLSLLLSLLHLWSQPVPHVSPSATRSEHRVPVCHATSAEAWIISRESDGDVHAYNPVVTSTGHAFGLGQLTDANRQHYGAEIGVNPNTTNYCGQLRLMRAYIADRYGSAETAVEYWRANGSY